MMLFRSGCAIAALICATPALAQTPTQEELAALVKAQAAEIAALRTRLDRLEGVQAAAVQPAPAPATPPVVMAQTPSQTGGNVTSPFAPQLVPPGPAERDVAQARQANAAGVTTEWGAGLPVFHSADGIYTFKPRGRILTDVSSTFGSDYAARNITTTGMRAA